MKEILILIGCFILFAVIVLTIIFHEYVSRLRKMLKKAQEEREARRMAEEDAYFKRTSTKNYREEDEGPKFKDDYFKSAEGQPKKQTRQQPQQETTTRRTTTDGGVTIIDDRGRQQSDRKIFDDNEGEYVDFEEVNS